MHPGHLSLIKSVEWIIGGKSLPPIAATMVSTSALSIRSDVL